MDGRIGQMALPIDKNDPAGVQRPAEDILDNERIRLAEGGPAKPKQAAKRKRRPGIF